MSTSSPEAHICLAFAKESKSEIFSLGIESYVYTMVAGRIYFLTHVVVA